MKCLKCSRRDTVKAAYGISWPKTLTSALCLECIRALTESRTPARQPEPGGTE